VTSNELDVDVAPGLGDAIAIADQKVESDGGPHEDRQDQKTQDCEHCRNAKRDARAMLIQAG
jgi:hypothetical protein